MTGVVKSDYSPKKGKENRNLSNNIPVLRHKNAKNEAKTEATTPKKTAVDKSSASEVTTTAPKKIPIADKKLAAATKVVDGSLSKSVEELVDSCGTTSDRSVRPQTKILRRPTPNLKHPVIQVVDSDDSSADSSSSDKAKDDNPKRLKMGNENSDSKRKNFIMYNKYNVDKNTKKEGKERTSATLVNTLIPNPCTSCNRSQAPERLHSHARKDARGLMARRSPAADVKMTSPQKKPLESVVRDSKVKNVKEVKSSPSTPSCSKPEDAKTVSDPPFVAPPSVVKRSNKKLTSSRSENTDCATGASVVVQPKTPIEDFIEPLKACYICQKEFKVSDLLLHESKCLETWKKSNNALTPNLRQLPPRRPDKLIPLVCPPANEDDPAWSTVQSQLIPCPLCGRTFFPERLPVHRRVCKGKQSPRPLKRASSLREHSASSTDGEESKPTPLYLPCYICNRNYGSWVLPMHEQQCLKKWRQENDKLAEDERQEEPRKANGLSPDHKLNEYKCLNNIDLYKADSKSLTAAKRKYPKCVENASPDLKYYSIKYKCVHGGTRLSKSSGQRKTQRGRNKSG